MYKFYHHIYFLVGISVLIGMSLGYIVGNKRAADFFISTTISNQPEIFGAGEELIEKLKDSDGNHFDLTSIFAFTREFFHCVVVTNDKEFDMPTYSLGNVKIGKNQFFMSVDSVRIDNIHKIGPKKIELSGLARSITRVGDMYEEALVPFRVTATDVGTKDSLILNVYYSEKKSPLQYKIFGPDTHFGHGIISGDISIVTKP